MGCNCKKSRPARPRPYSPSPSQTSSKPAEGKTQNFALEVPGQRTQTFGSRLEADAANVRSGFRGQVKPA